MRRNSLPLVAVALLIAGACGETATTPTQVPDQTIGPAFDDISNNLDATIDATAETMSLVVGGPNGTTQLFVDPTNGDGKNGCNLTGGTTLVVSVASSNTAVATVTPASVTFTSCGATPALTIVPLSAGTATISLGLTSNSTAGTFDLAPATFTVNVTTSNTPPSVSVLGVAAGASYEIGSVPTATCSVTDTEDGNSTFPATLGAITGPYAAFGVGSQTASCSYTDGGGLTATASATYDIVDTAAPVILFVSRTPSANGFGWNNTDVTVEWSCSDAGSGVVAASVTQVVSAEGANLSATGTCVDNVGQDASDTQTGINIDRTAPTITPGAAPPANGNGWHNTDVTVTFVGSDGLSGIDTCTADVMLTTEGANQSASGSCTDKAGNTASAEVTGISIDKTKPAIAGSRTPTANGNGWNNTDVVVSFVCTDGGSGLDVNTVAGQTLMGEGANQSVTNSGTCTDRAGNTADAATVSGINIDKTAPNASASASPAPNAAGWNNTNVTVSFSGSDALSGIVGCSTPVVLSSDGAGQSASGTCTDEAGNVSAPATAANINIDKTAPSVAVTGVTNGATYTLGSVPAAACTTMDALSGVATPASLSSSGGPVGAVTATCSGAKDNADNGAGPVTVTYSVVYDWAGFFRPIENGTVWNSVKAGSAIPVKFSLGGNQGLNIFAVGYPKSVVVACNTSDPTDAVEETVTAGGSSLTYDPVANQYVYVWKTEKTWTGCRRLDVKLIDGTTHSANFKFTK